MNIISELIAWLKTNPGLGASEARYFRGQLKDDATTPGQRLISVLAVGGTPGVLLDKNLVCVMVLGPQNNPAGEMAAIEDALTALTKRVKDDYKACGIAQIAVIGGIIGPGLTTENRPWYEINLELIT